MQKRNNISDCIDIISARSKRNFLTGCLEWQGLLSSKGYGKVSCDRKMASVHRIVYEYAHGKIEEGMHVLHHCDVRNCCEVAHLYLGDNLDNIKDKVERDRASKAISKEQAVKIIDLVKVQGKKQCEVASMYGIHQSNVSRICNGTRRPSIQRGA